MTIRIKTDNQHNPYVCFSNIVDYDYNETTQELTIFIRTNNESFTFYDVKEVIILSI